MYVLILLGIVTGAAAVALLIKPEVCFEFARRYFLSPKFQYGTGIFSLFLAMALYFSAAASKFPTFFEVVALLILAGGVICLALPTSDFRDLVSWEPKLFSPYGRIVGVWYAFIGGFLIYAAT